MHYALKKHVDAGFIIVSRFEDNKAVLDEIAKAKAADPRGSFVVEQIHTPLEDEVIAKPKRPRKGDL